MKYSEKEYPLQKESYQIIGICMEVHRILGRGLLEIIYKAAIQYELNNKKSHFIICESVATKHEL
ncbi:MAG: GxxExxY protein [Methylococcales bacterium]|nr:GxxExxY protein [Methylococcales bacterium]